MRCFWLACGNLAARKHTHAAARSCSGQMIADVFVIAKVVQCSRQMQCRFFEACYFIRVAALLSCVLFIVAMFELFFTYGHF